MKKIILYLSFCMLIAGSSSCKKYDNYPEPAETLTGSVTDIASGKGVQTETGSGTRVKLLELSWNDTPTPYYFYSEQDGSFKNTKIFKGNYKISVEGPFVPLVQNNASGTVTVDNSQVLNVAGTSHVDFKVEPFLNVEWVGEPVYNAMAGTVTASFKFSRGTANPAYQLDITDAYLFESPFPYVGNNNKDDRYSNQVSYSGASGSALLGQTINITTKDKLPAKTTLYFRVGARVAYGLNYYNYTEVKQIIIP
ncbi:MAG: hypothetical protein JWQ28_400 [Pedobacter sp.]|jgi:hypothetical protein|nr:hypothetical protein [Pedobacter sp.]